MALFPRRAASVLAGSALAFSLVSVPSAMVATAAAQSAVSGECGISESKKWTTAAVGYEITNAWGDGGLVAPGQQITMTTTVKGAYHLVDQMRQYYPQGFEPVKARVGSYKALNGAATWSDHSADLGGESGTVKIDSLGWSTLFGPVVLEVTYKAPGDAIVGSRFSSGAGANLELASGADHRDMDACVTIREPNPVESVQGSLEGFGAGSLVEGSVASSGIVSDPSGFVGEAIGGILGNIIGGVVES